MWKPQVRYLTCADPENFLEGGHLQTRMGPAPYQWSRHKSIKMGRSWHRFLLLVQDLMILIILSPQILGLLRLYFPLSREKMMVEPGTVSVQ